MVILCCKLWCWMLNCRLFWLVKYMMFCVGFLLIVWLSLVSCCVRIKVWLLVVFGMNFYVLFFVLCLIFICGMGRLFCYRLVIVFCWKVGLMRISFCWVLCLMVFFLIICWWISRGCWRKFGVILGVMCVRSVLLFCWCFIWFMVIISCWCILMWC